MKHLIVFLLAGFCLPLTAAVNTNKINLSVKEASLENVFKEIHHQTGYYFLYASRLVASSPKVTIAIKNAGITEALDLIFKRVKLQYTIIDSTIVIRTGKSLARAGPVTKREPVLLFRS